MPSHHGVGLDEHERRHFRQVWASTIQTADLASGLRTAYRAFQRVKLLAEREVLENQFVMSATGQRQRAEEYKGHLQHLSIVAFPPGPDQPSPRSVLIVARTGGILRHPVPDPLPSVRLTRCKVCGRRGVSLAFRLSLACVA
jgi:hypothetical protein